MSITITWHGHATFSLNIGGTAVVVDPFFAGNNPAAKTAVGAVAADYILQTHGHGDHIADTVPLAKRTGATVVGNFEICNWIAANGHENNHAMNTGGGWNFPFGRVKMTYALHSSGLPDGSYGGNPGGFVITTEGKHIYIAGDTALFSDMSLIGQMGLDVAILPIGDNFTMGPDDAVEAIKLLKPKVVIPCHYNTWPPIAVDAAAWAKLVNQHTSAQPVVLGIDETYSV
ncbi:MAG: metal-dependent hydrolase [Chloroflexi bacterium]|nr:metal-dependent hydrolase [Chloroflexota bacterium]MBK6710204.1 metal-dependent hydrolase [Chloroflexota bacterium]MBK7178473.1 metal-dependent hydrolase [Chloroflexota bacterium]MBK8933421.1 metal-dependent hydrolase [Chloroflexota bacterium]MBP7592166.1 metal-dependent hydrolase [Chloroflexota bacterium]